MKINIYYQTYMRQNFSAEDFFDNIILKIDPTFNYSVSKVVTIYVPLAAQEVSEEKKKGRLISFLGPDEVPNLLAKQIIITFPDIDQDYTEIRDYLILNYGEKATKIECIDERYLNDIN